MNLSDVKNLVTVRKVTQEDSLVYLEVLSKFHEASPMNKVCEMDREGSLEFLDGALKNPDFGIFLAEMNGQVIGGGGGLVYPLYFCKSHLVAQELWWWLAPKARGSGGGNLMFKELQSWAKERGAKTIFMIALEDERSAKMEKVYCRAGFEPMERTFMKGIL